MNENGGGAMRGQVSTELLIIVGLILVLFIPVLITIYLKAAEANDRIASLQASIALSRLASTANAVGSLGGGAYAVAELYVPGQVQSIEFNPLGEGGEIVFSIRQQNETSEVVDVVKFPLRGPVFENPRDGIYRFNISNNEGSIEIEWLK